MCVYAHTTDADVVLSETRLSKSVSDNNVLINGYNMYQTDRPRRAGGVAVYVKSKFLVNLLLSKPVMKQFEILALELKVSNSTCLTVVQCPVCLDTASFQLELQGT